MKKTLEKYNNFITNEVETWRNRLTWMGIDGRTPKHTTTICKFFNETEYLNDLLNINEVNKLYTALCNLADKYVEWVQGKGNNYSKRECNDMRNFFVGAMGEFFFVELLNEVRCLYIPLPESNEYNRFDFHYVSPSLSTDRDFGIDLTGIANDIPCVFQVKFWNPFGKEKLPIEVFQKADSEGSRNKFINQEDDNNIFLCWLGTEERGIFPLKDNKAYKNKIVIVGCRTLQASINQKNQLFWDNFFEKIKKVCILA